MQKMLGVAAVMMLGVSTAQGSAVIGVSDKEIPLSTTKEQKPVPHMIVLASGCGGPHARMLPRCKN